MNDLIKKYIQQHRADFDTAVPGAQGWSGVEKMLQRLPQADALEKFVACERMLFDEQVPSDLLWARIEAVLPKNIDLEQFIQQNRCDFDAELPGVQAWEQIAHQLPKPPVRRIYMHWQRSLARVAASLALIVVGIGAGIWYERQDSPSDGMAMSDVSNEYAELEQFYQQGITQKQAKLANFAPQQTEEIGRDLAQMDEMMEQLRRELATVPSSNREQVVRAMIENYQAKTAILQRVLEYLEETKTGGDNSKQRNEIKNI